MKCLTCEREVPGGATVCDSCRAAAVTGLTDESPQKEAPAGAAGAPDRGAADARAEVVGASPPQGKGERRPEPAAAQPRGSRPAESWRPKRDRVDRWLEGAASYEVSHYDVLELPESAGRDQIEARLAELRAALNRWSYDNDADLQHLAKKGLSRFLTLKADLEDRAAYDQKLGQQKRLRNIKKISETFCEVVGEDKVLTTSRWKTLRGWAHAAGLTPEELEQVVEELKRRGVKTGISVGGREVRSLRALKEVCGADGEKLLEVFKSGELESWLQQAAEDADKAARVKKLREEYKTYPQLGAQLWLWEETRDPRLVLSCEGARQEVESLKQWVEALYSAGQNRASLFEASLRLMKRRVLEHWLKLVGAPGDLCALAARQRELLENKMFKDERVLWHLVWRAESHCMPPALTHRATDWAYRQTQNLVKGNIPEDLYQHAINCALLGRLDEMREHLQRALAGGEDVARRALAAPPFRAEGVRQGVEDAVREKFPHLLPDPAVEQAEGGGGSAPAGTWLTYLVYLKWATAAALLLILGVLLWRLAQPPPPLPSVLSLTPHEGGVASLAFSPDGKILATGGLTRWVKLQNLNAEIKQTLLLDGGSAPRAVAFSPDGHLLATSSKQPGLLSLWGLRGGLIEFAKCERREGQTDWCVDLADHRSRREAEGQSVVDQAPGVMRMDGTMNSVSAIVFSIKGLVAGVGGKGQVKLWSVADRKVIPLEGEEARPPAAFSPDGKWLATGGNRQVLVWDLKEMKVKAKCPIEADGPGALAFSPDGGLLAGGYDASTLALWDVTEAVSQYAGYKQAASWKKRLVYGFNSPQLLAVAFSPDGEYLAAVGRDTPNVRVWNRQMMEAEARGQEFRHDTPVTALAFSPPSQGGWWLAIGEAGGKVTLWGQQKMPGRSGGA